MKQMKFQTLCKWLVDCNQRMQGVSTAQLLVMAELDNVDLWFLSLLITHHKSGIHGYVCMRMSQ